MNKITKKIYLVLILAIAGIASASAQRIYGSELKDVKTDAGYDLSFTLNAPATSGDIILKSTTSSDSVVIPFGALSKGSNTVSVAQSQVSAGVKYTWEVKATGAAITGTDPVKFTDDTNPLMQFNFAPGIAVDKSFDSPYFGRIYVTSSTTGAALGGRNNTQGVYVLDAALTDVTNQGDNAWTGNVTWAASSSNPFRLAVAPDGKVFVASWANAWSGVWIMDPANPSGDFAPVFSNLDVARTSGKHFATDGTTLVGGAVRCLYVTGTGASEVLYTGDDQYYVDGETTYWTNVLQYNIGSATLPWDAAPSDVSWDSGAGAQAMGSAAIGLGGIPYASYGDMAPDGQGGFFYSQSRNPNNPSNDATVVPVLWHQPNWAVGSQGSPGYYDFNSGDNALIGGSVRAALATTYDGSMIAVAADSTADASYYNIYNVTYDENDAPTLKLAYKIPAAWNGGSYTVSMSFDRAGNLYAIPTWANVVEGFALPTDDNTFTSPAPSTQVLDFSSTGIITPKVSQFQVNPNPVQDVAHISGVAAIESVKLVDLSGRVIMNQKQTSAEIDLSGVAAGTYILFVNNTPVKILKK